MVHLYQVVRLGQASAAPHSDRRQWHGLPRPRTNVGLQYVTVPRPLSSIRVVRVERVLAGLRDRHAGSQPPHDCHEHVWWISVQHFRRSSDLQCTQLCHRLLGIDVGSVVAVQQDMRQWRHPALPRCHGAGVSHRPGVPRCERDTALCNRVLPRRLSADAVVGVERVLAALCKRLAAAGAVCLCAPSARWRHVRSAVRAEGVQCACVSR